MASYTGNPTWLKGYITMMVLKGHTAAYIASTLNCNPTTIRRRMCIWRIPSSNKRFRAFLQREIELKGLERVSKSLGISPSVLTQLLTDPSSIPDPTP